MCEAQSVILGEEVAGCSKAVSELAVAGHVRLESLVEEKSVGQVVSLGETVIEASHPVPEVVRIGERYADRSHLNRIAIDVLSRCWIILAHDPVDFRQEGQRVENRLPTFGCLTRTQRNTGEGGKALGSGDGCWLRIPGIRRFPAAVRLQKSEIEGAVLSDGASNAPT